MEKSCINYLQHYKISELEIKKIFICHQISRLQKQKIIIFKLKICGSIMM